MAKLALSLSVVSERLLLCIQSLSDPGLILNLLARPRIGTGMALVSDFGTGMDEVGERVGLDPGEDMECVKLGRLRNMEGENVSSLLLREGDFSSASGERNPALR